MILMRLATNVSMPRQVVLVDEQDNEMGTADIFAAHQGKGLKHRALSVILYRKRAGKTELLLQKRAGVKPVFKHLWSNTCCTNMRVGDTYIPRAVSRLEEEMGIRVKPQDLRVLYRFSYDVLDEANLGWCENELDTILVGEWDGNMEINLEEAEEAKWMDLDELVHDIQKDPTVYSPWYRTIVTDKRFLEAVG